MIQYSRFGFEEDSMGPWWIPVILVLAFAVDGVLTAVRHRLDRRVVEQYDYESEMEGEWWLESLAVKYRRLWCRFRKQTL
ncbi:MAG: hypothetical protein KW802_00390 [Candidatus Doudnabacteria bacterium]|nr:hypothetical protein [Candidatus Doudnabacteria bacterium]